MSLGQALAIAKAGLRVTQNNMAVVAGNVSNVETPGYVRKTLNQISTVSSEFGTGVRAEGVNRELEAYVQSQLRMEQSGASFAGTRATVFGRLQSLYGTPGAPGTLEATFNAFSNSLQALATSSDSQSARISVINAARALSQQLNSMTNGIQSLRADAENGIATGVNAVNNALAKIAAINNQLKTFGTSDASSAALLDQRDQYVDQVAQMMDVRVLINTDNQLNLFTNSGVQLVGAEAATISFNAQGTVTANTAWNADPAKSTMGSITINFPQGGSLDLISTKSIRSGALAAYVELRDQTLVQAQAEVDQMAAAMASAASDRRTAGTAVTAGAQAGFEVDVGALKSGNIIELTYRNNATAQMQTVSIVRVDDPSVLPLSNAVTAKPGDQVIGINFSGGMASVVAQLNAALGPANLSFSNPSGTMLRVLDDGAPNLSDVTGMTATTTQTALVNGGLEIPLFNDGGIPYSGSITATGMQLNGFAGRITVNTALMADPSKLVVYSTVPPTPAGDTARPNFLFDRMTRNSQAFTLQGADNSTTSFIGPIPRFLQQFISMQGESANAAIQLSKGQDVVVATLRQKFASAAGVNIDTEMAHLLTLQQAYGANARVMSTVKEMYEALLRI